MNIDTQMEHPAPAPIIVKRRKRVKPLDIVMFREMMIESLFGQVNRCAECSAPMTEGRKVFCERCLGDKA